jgi:hypothetical protein
MGLMIIVHIMLEFYCLVFFGCSVAIFKRRVVSGSPSFKGNDAIIFNSLAGLGFRAVH